MAFKLDASGDLSRTNGRLDLLDEVDDRDQVIAQRIAIRLRRWRGEWSFDTRLGMDWDFLFLKGTSTATLRAAIIREICQVPGVRAVTELSVSVSAARVATITGRVQVAAATEAITFSADVGA